MGFRGPKAHPNRVEKPRLLFALCSRFIRLGGFFMKFRGRNAIPTGHGDVKSLNGRTGDMRLRVGKWRIFFSVEPPDLIRVLGIDNRGEAY
jgi:mRNA-degrading endonuclease RelE of RelBE toxin-antitoxin system